MGWNDRMNHPEVYGEQYGRDYIPRYSTVENSREGRVPTCEYCGEGEDLWDDDNGALTCADCHAQHAAEDRR